MVGCQHLFAIRECLSDPALSGDNAFDNGCDDDVAHDDPDYNFDNDPQPTLAAQETSK